MSYLTSSQEFIHLLHSHDKHSTSLPSKIDIASQAWHTKSFYLPSKAQVLVEWLLTTLIASSSSRSLLSCTLNHNRNDERYWSLLLSILTTTDPKPWLAPLIHRLPPLTNTLIACLTHEHLLETTFSKSMAVLFPLASRRMSLDALADVVSAVFRFVLLRGAGAGEMSVLLMMILGEYKRAFGVASVPVKKKVYNHFLQSYLEHWIQAISSTPSSIENTLQKDIPPSILAVGIETLLNLDVLRFTECHLRVQTQAQSGEAHDSSSSKVVHLVDRLGQSLNCPERLEDGAAAADMKTVMLEFLPILYASYLKAVYRYRSQLFTTSHGGSSSSTTPITTRDGYRKAACAFLGGLLALVDAVKVEGTCMVDVWRTRVGLLRVLEAEGGYVPGGGGDEEEEEEEKGPQEMLREIVSRVVALLDQPPSPSLKPLAIRSVSAIIRIDYDLVKAFVPPLLARVLVLPLDLDLDDEGEPEPYIEFLDLLLECHVKTRTLDELVGMMVAGVWEGPASLQGRAGAVAVVVVEYGPFLDRLGRAIRSFGTVGQCVGLIGCVVGFVERALRVLEGSVEDGVGLRIERGARIVCVVLACLNFEMVSSSSAEGGKGKLEEVRGRVDNVVRRLVGRLLSLDERLDGELECGLCALLRVKYVFDRDVVVGSVGDGDGHVGVLEGLVCLVERERELKEEALLPELVFELVRTMFLRISTRRRRSYTTSTFVISEKGQGEPKGKEKTTALNKQSNENERFFDTFLAFVERYYYYPAAAGVNGGWSGTECELAMRGKEGKMKCALALVWMVVERWLGEVDLLATPKQIRRFLDVVFGVGVVRLDVEKGKEGLVSPEGIRLNMLHSAWFWELGGVRKELVELLKARLPPNRLEGGHDVALVKERISTFSVLLYFPLEYFSFQMLCSFVGCAVEVDEGLARIWDGDNDGGEVMRGLVVLRMFVRRVCVFVGGGGVLDFRGKSEVELLWRMLEEPNVMDRDVVVREAYLSASLDLAEVWLMKLFKSSKKTNDPEPVLRLLKSFNLDSICGSERGHKRTLTCECFIRMVKLLDRDVLSNAAAGAGVHEDVLEALRVLRLELVEGLYVRIVREVSKEGLEDEVRVGEWVGLVRVWDGLMCLGRSVGDLGLTLGDRRPSPSRFVADKLVSVLMPYVQLKDVLDGGLAELFIGVFSVMLGEVEFRYPRSSVSDDGGGGEHEGEGQRLRYLEVVLAVYVSLANKVSVSGIKEMDVRLGRTARQLGVSDFEHLLSFIAESLLDADERETAYKARFTQLVHVGSLLIRDHPSHSLACIQKFMARCLGLFNDNPVYVQGDEDWTLGLQVLEMVGQYCSDQQASLRAQDTSLIWLLLSKSLAPSQVHDLDTRTEIFHKIVSILMCLIRLRRDLVVLGLPHLGLILRRMVQALRGCRPNLGAKQMAIVMNTQPRWVSNCRSLGGEEARALSRLLESLTVKTTIRLHFSADASNPTKAESLAKPFSKHAAYVLKAYVDAMNDPLCVVSLEVRKELREGLFALCGMMGVHTRDALMVGGGLDAGGKLVLKSVWKEWEGVRYVGKG